MYNQVISLGFFCSVALELQRINLRSKSGPFDWVISELPGVMELINNRFSDYLNPDLLLQDADYPYIFTNLKYQVAFYHDFSPDMPAKDQIKAVKLKYAKRIDQFYRDIKSTTLFIRYIKNQAEYDWLIVNCQELLNTLKQFNINNELLLIANDDLKERQTLPVKGIYKVEKDAGDQVARQFLDKNAELMQLLCGPVISEHARLLNKRWKSSVRIGD